MKTYKWMEDCIVVDGYLRSCIYDLTRRETHFVDRNTNALIKKIESLPSDKIRHELNDEELEWFNFFIKKEFLFEVPSSQIEYLQKMPMRWSHSSKIMSAVIEYSEYLPKLLLFLDALNCKHIILSFQNANNIRVVLEKHFKTTFLKSLDIIVENNDNDRDYYEDLLSKYPVLINIFIKQSNKNVKSSKKNQFRRIINVSSSTGNTLKFAMSNKVFMESQFHNVYLNGKIFVKKDGSFFNTPESNKKLGNIEHVETSENLLKRSKTKAWNATKNNTYVCEDCELRNMCVDNRIPEWRDHDKKWYYKEECEYNPYIALWKGEEGYLNLNTIGVNLKEEGLKIDNVKLTRLTESIW